MGEGPAYCGWGSPGAGGPGFYPKSNLSKPRGANQSAAFLHGLRSHLQVPALLGLLARLLSVLDCYLEVQVKQIRVGFGLGVL